MGWLVMVKKEGRGLLMDDKGSNFEIMHDLA